MLGNIYVKGDPRKCLKKTCFHLLPKIAIKLNIRTELRKRRIIHLTSIFVFFCLDHFSSSILGLLCSEEGILALIVTRVYSCESKLKNLEQLTFEFNKNIPSHLRFSLLCQGNQWFRLRSGIDDYFFANFEIVSS